MLARLIGAGIVAAVAAAPCHAQSFTPSEQQYLLQPSPVTSPDTSKSGKKGAKAAQQGAVSLSSELRGGGAAQASTAPTLSAPRAAPAPSKPFDERVPFGPLSLGLQADSGPRSDQLSTPRPAGLDQFKKDKFEPYVGVSIIDIKR